MRSEREIRRKRDLIQSLDEEGCLNDRGRATLDTLNWVLEE